MKERPLKRFGKREIKDISCNFKENITAQTYSAGHRKIVCIMQYVVIQDGYRDIVTGYRHIAT